MNPPHLVLVLLPLGWFSIRAAAMIWLALTVLAMLACLRLWARMLPRGWAVGVFALLLVSVAGWGNLRFGNQSWLAAVAVTWAWFQWKRGRVHPACAVFGVVASVKLFLLIVGAYLAWKRKWRPLLAFGAGAGTAVAVGLLVVGPDAYRSWWAALQEQSWQGSELNISVLGALTRTLDAGATRFAPLVAAPALILPLWLGSCAALSAVLWWYLRRSDDIDQALAALLMAMLLVSPSGWAYYLPLTAGPLAATAAARPSILWWLPVGCYLVPYAFLTLGQPAPLLTITLGTIYTWAGLSLLALTLRKGVECARRSGVQVQHDALRTGA